MSTPSDAADTAAPPRCPRCGVPMAPEQDWCLECGTAVTTRVVPPPGWRVPLAVVLGALVLLGAVLAIAVSLLSDDADQAAGGRAATAARERPRPATGAPVPLWPRAKRAYTVVVYTLRKRPDAEERARRLIAAGRDSGILRTNGFDFFAPGYWLVWAGQYTGRPAAERARPGLAAKAPAAYVTLVRRKPGA